MKKVAVVGLGYVGLPTLVAISESKLYTVCGYDVDTNKIATLTKGISPIEDSAVESYLASNSLQVSSDITTIADADIYIVCVPTPVVDGYLPDYSIVVKAITSIAGFVKKGTHIVLESTVNPGTCDEIMIPLLHKKTKLDATKDYNMAHCPERINPGDSKWNIYNINRNIGSSNPTMSSEITDFYQSFISKAVINQVSSLRIAEATKIVENTFRDINIAFVNELAKSFDAMQIDVHETIKAAANKPFGYMAHWPGAGVGGHCIAVDPYYLIERAAQSGFDHKFLKLAREINNSMPKYAVQRLLHGLNTIKKSLKGTKVALLGLSYKPNLSDDRESPSYDILQELQYYEADVVSCDPYVSSADTQELPEALKEAEAVIVATAHQEFVDGLTKALKKSQVQVVVDGRNCLDKKQIEALGIIYKGIGR